MVVEMRARRARRRAIASVAIVAFGAAREGSCQPAVGSTAASTNAPTARSGDVSTCEDSISVPIARVNAKGVSDVRGFFQFTSSFNANISA